MGNFSWSNGSRLYYSNLTSNFSTERRNTPSRASRRSRSRTPTTWPAAAARRCGRLGGSGDRHRGAPEHHDASPTSPTMWADNAASSPFFGDLYVCYTQFKQPAGQWPGADRRAAAPPMAADTWTGPDAEPLAQQRRSAGGPPGLHDAHRQPGQGLRRVGGHGQEADAACCCSTSTDGGDKFSKARVVAQVTDVGDLRRRALDLVRRDRRGAHQLVPEPQRSRTALQAAAGRAEHDRPRVVRRARRPEQ